MSAMADVLTPWVGDDELADIRWEKDLQVFRCPVKGRGVLTLTPRPRGSFVVEYQGELLPREVGRKRFSDRPAELGSFLYEISYRGTTLYIDATQDVHVGRLINHSRRGNLKPKVFRSSGGPVLLFPASTDIPALTEILYDYGDRNLAEFPFLGDGSEPRQFGCSVDVKGGARMVGDERAEEIVREVEIEYGEWRRMAEEDERQRVVEGGDRRVGKVQREEEEAEEREGQEAGEEPEGAEEEEAAGQLPPGWRYWGEVRYDKRCRRDGHGQHRQQLCPWCGGRSFHVWKRHVPICPARS